MHVRIFYRIFWISIFNTCSYGELFTGVSPIAWIRLDVCCHLLSINVQVVIAGKAWPPSHFATAAVIITRNERLLQSMNPEPPGGGEGGTRHSCGRGGGAAGDRKPVTIYLTKKKKIICIPCRNIAPSQLRLDRCPIAGLS